MLFHNSRNKNKSLVDFSIFNSSLACVFEKLTFNNPIHLVNVTLGNTVNNWFPVRKWYTHLFALNKGCKKTEFYMRTYIRVNIILVQACLPKLNGQTRHKKWTKWIFKENGWCKSKWKQVVVAFLHANRAVFLCVRCFDWRNYVKVVDEACLSFWSRHLTNKYKPQLLILSERIFRIDFISFSLHDTVPIPRSIFVHICVPFLFHYANLILWY